LVIATFEAVLPKQGCVVPKVTRKGLAAAKRAIKRARCRVGKIRKAYSKNVRKGRVIAQKPRPHAKLAVGPRIRHTVSKGPKPRH
jgi:beta-lactam-binding protein with PASTA domain